MRNHRFLLVVAMFVLLFGRGTIVCAEEGPAVLPPPGASLPVFVAPPTAPSPGLLQDVGLDNSLQPVVPSHTARWFEPAYWFGPDFWDIGLELGINGSDGANETFSQRAGGHINRDTELWKFGSTLVYNKNTANDLETQNDALLDVRFDRLLGESPWTLFFLNQLQYDEFQAYDLRLSLHSGMGYQFAKTKTIDLLGRFGAGASREFGATDERWAQEALFGIDYEHSITPTQRLIAKIDYFPEWDNFNKYRVVADLGWEIDLDKPENVSLKLSVIDRYDSTPNGLPANSLDYAVLLIWGL